MIRKIGLALLLSGGILTAAQAQEETKYTRTNLHEDANVIRIAPLTAMDIGYGFGLSYERLLGTNKNVGLILPFSLLLEKGTGGVYGSRGNNTYFYFTPGVKIYPFGQRKITYAVGPSLMFGYGKNPDHYGYIYQNGLTAEEDIQLKKFRMGLLVNNYISFQITKALSLGFEAGVGMRYLDREYFNSSGIFWGSERVQFRNGFNITGQGSMTIGIKF